MAAGHVRRDGYCYVASLKYSPIMWNHARAVGEPIAQQDVPVRYLLDEGYGWMLGEGRGDCDLLPSAQGANPLRHLVAFLRGGGSRSVRERFRAQAPAVLVFVNLNPLIDRVVLRIARRANPQLRVVALLHEPHAAEKSIYGRTRALLLHVYEWLSRDMARRCDAIILPSETAREAFDAHYRGFRGERRVIPLSFADERCEEALERRYVSFIGHIAHARQKGLDLFLEMVEEAARRGSDHLFQIVTSEDPSRALAGLSSEARARLHVVHRDRLTDQEISRAIRASKAVVLLQRRVMQSGVVPMAMMNGTPVLASDLDGLTQFVTQGETGEVLPVDPSLDARFEALDRIDAKLDEMSPRCRKLYEETFDSRRVIPSVPWILGRSASTPL